MCIRFSTTCVLHIWRRTLNAVHLHDTRSSRYNFLVLHCRSVEHSTFYYRGIAGWNSLPDWLKEIEKPRGFKASLKKYLTEHHQETEIGDFFFYWLHKCFFLSHMLKWFRICDILLSCLSRAPDDYGQLYAEQICPPAGVGVVTLSWVWSLVGLFPITWEHSSGWRGLVWSVYDSLPH